MWRDLQRGILEDFASFPAPPDAHAYGMRLATSHDDTESGRAWQGVQKSNRLRRRRIVEAATRPPCPHCGGAVVRLGTTGKLPKYCRPECMRAAKWARWYEAHREERLAQRRAA